MHVGCVRSARRALRREGSPCWSRTDRRRAAGPGKPPCPSPSRRHGLTNASPPRSKERLPIHCRERRESLQPLTVVHAAVLPEAGGHASQSLARREPLLLPPAPTLPPRGRRRE